MAVIGILLCAVLSGCSQAISDSSKADRLVVAVSILPEAWLVERIGGEHVDVVTLVLPGESPHTYQPSDAQVSRLMQAAVYFPIGISFEKGPWFQAVQNSQKLKIVNLRDGIMLRKMEDDPDHCSDGECTEDGRDPHIWTSPRLLKTQAATISRILCEIDAPHSAIYKTRLTALNKDLDQLDQKIRDRLQGLKRRSFFVFHPAWGYFADEYKLRQQAIEVEGKDPSDQELTELQREARKEGVSVIFVQPQIFGKAAQAIAQATGARVEIADPLAADLSAELLRMASALADADKK